MKKYVLLLAVVCCVAFANAQINGIVRDDKSKAISNASVSLKRGKDSSIVKLSVTSADGKYRFVNIKEGKYFISISHVGFNPKKSNLFEVSGSGEVTVPEISISKQEGKLNEVTITAVKPMVEVKADKIILTVA